MDRARPLVVGCSAGTLIMGVISIYFLLLAYTAYRSDDFVTATETSDFATKGTCVESVTHEIVEDANFMDASWDCTKEKDKLARLLLSQTHSIYYLHKTAPSPEVTDVAISLMASTIGSASLSINTSMAYNVLRMLGDDNVTVPTNCSSIYTEPSSTFYDTLDQKLPTIACSATLTGSNPVSFSSTEWGKLLYACNKQFYFGRSGPHVDTYGIPLLNEPPGPNGDMWKNMNGLNETSPWSVKSRMFLGFRFGWSLWAYVPSILALAFLTIDAALVLLVETTVSARAAGLIKVETGDTKDLKGRMRTRLATYQSKRDTRFSFATLLVLNAIAWMVATVWVPWGVWHPRLGRPVCRVDDDDPDWAYFFYKKTQGGWQSDASCLSLEVCVIAAQIFILFALPLSHKVKNEVEEDKNANSGLGNSKRWVKVLQGARGGAVLIFVTVVGLIALVAGSAFSGSVFGNAWARAVTDESVPWDETMVAEYIYDMNLGGLVSILAGGLVLGVVVGRWMFTSFTCESLQVFIVWIIFALGAFVPIITVFSVNYFTDKDEQVADCGFFPDDGNYKIERSSCESRYWLVVVGTCSLGLVVLLLSVLGLAESLLRGTCFRISRRARVQPGPSTDAGIPSITINPTFPGGRYESKDEAFFNFESTKATDDATRSLLSPSPPPSASDSFQVAAPAAMRFTLNPSTIVPLKTRL